MKPHKIAITKRIEELVTPLVEVLHWENELTKEAAVLMLSYLTVIDKSKIKDAHKVVIREYKSLLKYA